jgi:hypothetical protein
VPTVRPYWKGYLKLALVSCPIALYTASSSSERVAFRQLNKKWAQSFERRHRAEKVQREHGLCWATAGIGNDRVDHSRRRIERLEAKMGGDEVTLEELVLWSYRGFARNGYSETQDGGLLPLRRDVAVQEAPGDAALVRNPWSERSARRVGARPRDDGFALCAPASDIAGPKAPNPSHSCRTV